MGIYFLLWLVKVRGECIDANCENCEGFDGSEFCGKCVGSLFPFGAFCVDCEVQPLECQVLDSGKVSCFCTSTLSSREFKSGTGLRECGKGQTCFICFEGFELVDGICEALGQDLNEKSFRGLQSLPNGCSKVSNKNPNACTKCIDGFYLVSTYCQACFNNCKTCSSFYTCTSCVSPQKLVKDSCCEAGCNNCYYGTCLACDNQYLFVNNKCEPCPSNCNACVAGVCNKWICSSNCDECNSSSCTKCSKGYFISNGGCSNCIAQCDVCVNSNTCSVCSTPFILVNGSCCPAGCSGCNSAKCLGCYSGYLFDGTKCNACPLSCGGCPNGMCNNVPSCSSGCLVCTSPSLCTKCSEGFYLDKGGCLKCNEKCKTCETADECGSCVANFNLVLKKCCNLECSACSFDKCFGCYTGYLYDGSKCNSCPPNCGGCPNGICQLAPVCSTNCESCISSSSCSVCSIGFYLSSNICLPCDPKCTKCESSTKCSECKSDLNPISGYCCPENCSSCDFTECKACKDGYLLENSSCFPCPEICESCLNGLCLSSKACNDHCLKCEVNGRCRECDQGYYSQGNSCLGCKKPCLSCESENKCKDCIDGFRVVGEFCCAVGCQSCDFFGCLACGDGYLMDCGVCFQCPETCYSCVGGKCILAQIGCPDNCQNCEAFNKCLKCVSGYFLLESACEKCRDHCEKCNSSGDCLDCVDGYISMTGYCCPAGCSICEIGKCLGCQTGFLFEFNDCYPCPESCNPCLNGICQLTQPVCPDYCLTCKSSEDCIECKFGFYKSDSGCIKCSDKCSDCDSKLGCIECVPEYEVINGSCCKKGCLACDDTCLQCADGYFFDSDNCIPCPDNCELCSPVFCSRCKSGFSLVGDECIKVDE